MITFAPVNILVVVC